MGGEERGEKGRRGQTETGHARVQGRGREACYISRHSEILKMLDAFNLKSSFLPRGVFEVALDALNVFSQLTTRLKGGTAKKETLFIWSFDNIWTRNSEWFHCSFFFFFVSKCRGKPQSRG